MSLLARRGSLFTPDAGSFTAPTFVGDPTTSWGLTGSTAVTADPPPGVASGHYQLVVAGIVSSSPTFGATPAGWTKLIDVTVTYSDAASTGRLGLFESTTATSAFSVPQVGSGRAWRSIRAAWAGHGGRVGNPVQTTTGVTGSPATPPVTTSDPNSLVIGIGMAEEPDAGTGWGFTGTGSFTTRSNATAVNAIESIALVVGDLVVATPSANVSTNYTLTNPSEAVMVSVVLRGAPA